MGAMRQVVRLTCRSRGTENSLLVCADLDLSALFHQPRVPNGTSRIPHLGCTSDGDARSGATDADLAGGDVAGGHVAGVDMAGGDQWEGTWREGTWQALDWTGW